MLVVTAEDPVLPSQQVGIAPGKFLPVGGRAPCHTLANEEEIRVGYGLMIEASLAPSRSEALQRDAEFVQRLQRRVLTQIGECQPNVIGMIDVVVGVVCA